MLSIKMEKVEEKLEKIAENTKPKYSFLVTLSGKGSKLEGVFEPEISIDAGCHYEIAFTSLDTFYSMPNINSSNNTLQVARINGSWQTLTVTPGCYGLIKLDEEISRMLEEIGLSRAVHFKANYNTFKCIMIIEAGYKVKFGSLGSVLGFDDGEYEAKGRKRVVAKHTVQILPINSILVHCDLAGGSYLNGTMEPIVYSFFPRVEPGEKIIEKPVEYIYLPVSSDIIRRMTVWLTDQNQNLLDLREEELTIRFHLRSC